MYREIYSYKKENTNKIKNLELPNIIFINYSPKHSVHHSTKKNKANLNQKNPYFNINNYNLPRLNKASPRYDKILKTENMKEMARNYLHNNKNILDYLKEKNEILQKKVIEKLKSDEPNNNYGNKIKNMIRLHSSKYHPEIEEDKSLKSEFDLMLNKLKYHNNNYDDDREIKYRQRLAFRYRFFVDKKINNKKMIEKKNISMNKLLNISKSIPNYLLQKIIDDKYNEIKIKNESNNNSIDLSSIYSKNSNNKKIKYLERINKSENNNNSKKRYSLFEKNGKKFIDNLNILL